MGLIKKWSEEKIRQFEAEGRGKGKGANYKPWVQVDDFSSLGKSRRAFSHKTGRVHHLLSDTEWNFFLLLEFADDIIDIREQFPLSRNETQSIAARLCIKHPTYPTTRVPAVMTTDFLVTRQMPGQAPTLEAYSCKRTEEAENTRSLEKLEVERLYFEDCEIAHRLVFHSTLPVHKVNNIEWCRNASLKDASHAASMDRLKNYAQRMLHELSKAQRNQSLSEYCTKFDTRIGAEPGTSLLLARVLLWEKQLLTDFNQPSLATAPLSIFKVGNTQTLKLVGN